MNYEELLETRDARKTNKVRIPYGFFYKRLIDGKYSNFVEFHDELADNIVFNECIRRECEVLEKFHSKCQLHFTPNEGDDGVYAIAVESGNYLSFEQLLNDAPAIVAKSDFIESTLQSLVDYTKTLHEQGVQYVCFAPSNVFARKNDSSVRLLLHGSLFLPLKMQEELFEGVEDYVAPEVMADGKADERSDVYSLAKFTDYLYTSSGLPFELKQVIAKATQEDPMQRYATVGDFYDAIKTHRNLRRTGTLAVAALAIALIVVGLFFEMLPNTEPVEFVKPVEEPVDDDLLDEGFNPLTELGPDADSATIAKAIQDYLMSDSDKVDEKKMREFEAKAEQIFRKQYTKAAEQILSKIYNTERMNNDEKVFKATSTEVMEELVEKQRELAKNSALSDATAQRIASEIIEQVSERKKAELEKKPNYGFQKAEEKD